jgi:hypothetical protein
MEDMEEIFDDFDNEDNDELIKIADLFEERFPVYDCDNNIVGIAPKGLLFPFYEKRIL